MGKSLKRETLEVLRGFNVQIQEENQQLKERIVELEKDLNTSTKKIPLLRNTLSNAKTLSPLLWKIGTREKFNSCH